MYFLGVSLFLAHRDSMALSGSAVGHPHPHNVQGGDVAG